MQLTVTFKGKTIDDKYHWENVADALPKQLNSLKCAVLSEKFPKVNQQYTIWFKKLNGHEIVEPYEINEHYQTCGYFKVEKGEFYFKKGINKGLSVTQYASSFPYNQKEEISFVKLLVNLYRRSTNSYTKNNIIRILNSGLIKYCEVFGDINSSIIQIGTKKGMDMKKVTIKEYPWIRSRLEYYQNHFISPVTYRNCESWIKYLDSKFKAV